MPKLILVIAVWLVRTPPSRIGDGNAGWLGRHSGRFRRALGLGERYVDLDPLDLNRRTG